MKLAGLVLAILLGFGCLAARADELHLKDGTKVIGTIVGYQGNSFRVKTAYGFALVERSAVVSITVTKVDAAPMAEKSSHAAEAKAFAAKSNADPKTSAGKTESAAAKTVVQNKSAAQNVDLKISPVADRAGQITSASNPAQTQRTASPSNSGAASTNAPQNSTAAPVTALEPPPVRERVLDNLYVNETYGFHLYKPPDWQMIQGARAALPGAIAALGTSDQSTYLIIGLEPADDTLLAHVTVTNDRLADSFDNFRPTVLRQTLIAGLPACEYQFQGMAENHLWAGTVALVRRGQDTFTIFGVTTATSDLVQIQQNVIARAIASLQFIQPQTK